MLLYICIEVQTTVGRGGGGVDADELPVEPGAEETGEEQEEGGETEETRTQVIYSLP